MRIPKHAAFTAMLVVSLLASQSRARAQLASEAGDTAGSGDAVEAAAGPVRFLRYLSCAALVYAAASMPVLVLAVGTCLHTVLDEAGSSG